ncbi:MAG TPA: FAD-dependent oxidoreductase [Burkholderiales bacterium]|nr:FAD-dependent oxidoreductase [Burkholderiales bacterium]
MDAPGTTNNPLRVAVVGAGPSGFYAAEALLKSGKTVRVDMIERLPAPYGLVRYGVAPDHPKLKEAILVYAVIARLPHFNLLGNVTVGRDVTVEELRAHYHGIIFACGAETDRHLGIPGEDLAGSHTATEFVAWYNGHPDYRERCFDLSAEVVAIIGQGNVAADVCRILAKSADELKSTDIAAHALDALATSRVREIHVIGRRGVAQAKFTNKELKELGELPNCDAIVDPRDLELNSESVVELEVKSNFVSAKNVEIFRAFAARGASGKPRRLIFHFLKSPVAIKGAAAHMEQVVLARNRLEGAPLQQAARETGETDLLQCGLLFRSIGYSGLPIPGVPFDARKGVFPTQDGRIVDGGAVMPGLYAAGWIKRGPTGIIGTNRADSIATVKSLLADLSRLAPEAKGGAEVLKPLLAARGTRVVSLDDWLKIDAAEVARGQSKGKPREKFTRVAEMLKCLDGS